MKLIFSVMSWILISLSSMAAIGHLIAFTKLGIPDGPYKYSVITITMLSILFLVVLFLFFVKHILDKKKEKAMNITIRKLALKKRLKKISKIRSSNRHKMSANELKEFKHEVMSELDESISC